MRCQQGRNLRNKSEFNKRWLIKGRITEIEKAYHAWFTRVSVFVLVVDVQVTRGTP